MKNIVTRFSAMMLCLLTAFCLSATAFAESGSDDGSSDAKHGVSIVFHHDDVPAVNAEFSLYRLSDRDYHLVESYDGYDIVLHDLDAAGLAETASTLAAYADRDGWQPTVTGHTDATGVLYLDNMPEGIYLVRGSAYQEGEYLYEPLPVLLFFPDIDENGLSVYDVTLETKYDYHKAYDNVSRTVVKIWSGDEHITRPNSITVQLFKDGEVYDERTLSDENNWWSEWTDLPGAYRWTVAEKTVPDDYAMSVEQNGDLFIITNTCDVPLLQQPLVNGLPLTGVVLWSVPVFAMVGSLIIIIVLLCKRDKKTEKQDS